VHRGTRPKVPLTPTRKYRIIKELAGWSSEVLSGLTASTWQTRSEIEHIVERVVSQVLQGHFSQLREDWCAVFSRNCHRS